MCRVREGLWSAQLRMDVFITLKTQGSGREDCKEPGMVDDFKETVFSRLIRTNALTKS